MRWAMAYDARTRTRMTKTEAEEMWTGWFKEHLSVDDFDFKIVSGRGHITLTDWTTCPEHGHRTTVQRRIYDGKVFRVVFKRGALKNLTRKDLGSLYKVFQHSDGIRKYSWHALCIELTHRNPRYKFLFTDIPGIPD
jgi:hypothetical protein